MDERADTLHLRDGFDNRFSCLTARASDEDHGFEYNPFTEDYLPDSFKNGTQKNADERGFFKKTGDKSFYQRFQRSSASKKRKVSGS